MNNQSYNEAAALPRDIPGFIFFRSYFEALQSLKPRQRHAVMDAMLEIAFTGNIPEMSGTVEAVVKAFIPNMISSGKRYGSVASRNEKAKKSAAAKKNECEETSIPAEQENPEKSDSEKGNNKEKENNKENKKENDRDMERDRDREKEPQDCRPESAPPDGGNTRAAQKSQALNIISEYAGDDSELLSLLTAWLDIRKARRQPTNPQTIRLNLEELKHLTADCDVKEYLREVVRRGWGTFFRLENPQRQPYNKSPKADDSDSPRSFDIDEFDRFTLGLDKDYGSTA